VRHLRSAFDARDLDGAIGLFGLVLLTLGCWLVYVPLGLIVPGLVLLALAVWRLRG